MALRPGPSLASRWAATSPRFRTALGIGLIVALMVGLLSFQLLRPVPAIAATILQPANSQLGPAAASLPWPATGSVAVAVDQLGTIATYGPQVALPLASTAKIMTGLLILERHPLRPAQQGPMVPRVRT